MNEQIEGGRTADDAGAPPRAQDRFAGAPGGDYQSDEATMGGVAAGDRGGPVPVSPSEDTAFEDPHDR